MSVIGPVIVAVLVNVAANVILIVAVIDPGLRVGVGAGDFGAA